MSQKRKRNLKSKIKLFLRDYNFEITVSFLLSLGVFLLVEDLEIKYFLYLLLKKIFFLFGNYIKNLGSFIFSFAQGFEFSDLVGISLISFALYLIAKRWRERIFQRFPSFIKCPTCGGELNRNKKKIKHKILSYLYFKKIKNYNCKVCNFNGIKFSNN